MQQSRRIWSGLWTNCCSRSGSPSTTPHSVLRSVAVHSSTRLSTTLDGGQLTSKFLLAAPKWGEVVRRRLLEDLQQLSKGLPHGEASVELNLEIVIGVILQLMRALGQGRLSSRDRDPAIGAILRAMGLDARRTKSVLAHLPAPQKDASRTGPGRSKSQPKRTTDSAA